MTEPTYIEHLVLSEIEAGGAALRMGSEQDMKMMWSLVRRGYLEKSIVLQTKYNWQFYLTDQAREYLQSLPQD